MERRTVTLRVANQTYRVITTASDADLKRFVDVIEERLLHLSSPGRPPAPNALLLVALGLVHELDEARAKAARSEARAREVLGRLLERIDAALEGEPTPTSAPLPASPT